MSLNAESYLHAAYPLRTPATLPRLFVLHWDNHKVLSKRRDKDDWHQAWGTLYPTGTVTLDNGMFYRNRDEMEAHYRAMGDMRVEWLDEKEA